MIEQLQKYGATNKLTFVPLVVSMKVRLTFNRHKILTYRYITYEFVEQVINPQQIFQYQ
jgi:hypothetical protein